MIARTQLVVLDYNCASNNTHKPQQKVREHRFKETFFQTDATLGSEKNIQNKRSIIYKQVIIFHRKSIL